MQISYEIVLNAHVRQLTVSLSKNPKNSKTIFGSLLNRSIQDLSDHGASKKKKNEEYTLEVKWILPLSPHLW